MLAWFRPDRGAAPSDPGSQFASPVKQRGHGSTGPHLP